MVEAQQQPHFFFGGEVCFFEVSWEEDTFHDPITLLNLG
jgi:hypothetical protein